VNGAGKTRTAPSPPPPLSTNRPPTRLRRLINPKTPYQYVMRVRDPRGLAGRGGAGRGGAGRGGADGVLGVVWCGVGRGRVSLGVGWGVPTPPPLPQPLQPCDWGGAPACLPASQPSLSARQKARARLPIVATAASRRRTPSTKPSPARAIAWRHPASLPPSHPLTLRQPPDHQPPPPPLVPLPCPATESVGGLRSRRRLSRVAHRQQSAESPIKQGNRSESAPTQQGRSAPSTSALAESRVHLTAGWAGAAAV
jgi:hypothetical protein